MSRVDTVVDWLILGCCWVWVGTVRGIDKVLDFCTLGEYGLRQR